MTARPAAPRGSQLKDGNARHQSPIARFQQWQEASRIRKARHGRRRADSSYRAMLARPHGNGQPRHRVEKRRGSTAAPHRGKSAVGVVGWTAAGLVAATALGLMWDRPWEQGFSNSSKGFFDDQLDKLFGQDQGSNRPPGQGQGAEPGTATAPPPVEVGPGEGSNGEPEPGYGPISPVDGKLDPPILTTDARAPIVQAIYQENQGVLSVEHARDLVHLGRTDPARFTEIVLTGNSAGMHLSACEGETPVTQMFIAAAASKAGEEAVAVNDFKTAARYWSVADWATQINSDLDKLIEPAERAAYRGERPSSQALDRVNDFQRELALGSLN